jgi:hypothetical protein
MTYLTVHPEAFFHAIYGVHCSETSKVDPNHALLWPLLRIPLSALSILTTQYAHGRVSDALKQHWRLIFPAWNVKQRNEPVASDTGVTAAQIFFGRESLVAHSYGLKTEKKFVSTLKINIWEWRAIDKLISDCAKAEMIERVKQSLQSLVISAWYSEPYHENQKFAEDCYATIKASTNHVMNFLGASAHTWLLALIYVCLLQKHLAGVAQGWKPLEQILTGQQPDIYKFMHFSFYDPVHYHSHSKTLPSASNEEQGWWVGSATHVGDALTYKILTKQNKVVYWSTIWSALDPAKCNISPLGVHLSRGYNVHLFQALLKTWMVIQVLKYAWLPLTQRT